MQHIAHVHAAIRSALDAFASEAASLQGSESLKPAALAALVERLRFLRAVCSYHSASEDDVLFPAVRWPSHLTDSSLSYHHHISMYVAPSLRVLKCCSRSV